MKTKKLIAIGCACAMTGVWAQGVVSLAPASGADEPTESQAVVDANLVKVQGRGVGTTKDAALKDAYRDAIERAVGLYVDAEQMVKNDELVSDQILTQSNAYIEKYDVVKESESDGLFTMRILATVRKTALTKKLGDVMPKQSVNLGNDAANFHAQIITKEKRNVDAVALLQNALKDVKPISQMMTFTLAETKMIPLKAQSGSTVYCYHFKMMLDEKKYFEEFLPALCKVLDQIAIEPPKEVRFRKCSLAEVNDYGAQQAVDVIARYVAGDWFDEPKMSRASAPRHMRKEPLSIKRSGSLEDVYGIREGDGGVFTESAFFANAQKIGWNFSLQSGMNRSVNFKYALENCNVFPVVVITQANGQRTNVRAKQYILPVSCANVIMDWERRTVLGQNEYVNDDNCFHSVYHIVFNDKDGEDVYSLPVSLANIALSNTRLDQNAALFGRDEGNRRERIGWYVTPFIHADAKEYHRWIGFEIPCDDLPKVASIEIEIDE